MKFEEKKVDRGELAQLNITEMEKGASILFYIGNFVDRSSAEYGDFKVVEGLLVDERARDLDALVATAEGASFIPNTMLLNMINDKKIVSGSFYRIEKAWDKDEKFENGKKAKGFGFDVFEIACDNDTLGRFLLRFTACKAGKAEEDTPPPLEAKRHRPHKHGREI